MATQNARGGWDLTDEEAAHIAQLSNASYPDDYDPQADEIRTREEMQDPTVAAMQEDGAQVAQQAAATLTRYSEEFDEMCEARHEMGAEKYGPGKFLTVDTLEEAMQEMADMANYLRYSYIKLRLLQEAILEQGIDSGTITEGGFLSGSDSTKLGKM